MTSSRVPRNGGRERRTFDPDQCRPLDPTPSGRIGAIFSDWPEGVCAAGLLLFLYPLTAFFHFFPNPAADAIFYAVLVCGFAGIGLLYSVRRFKWWTSL